MNRDDRFLKREYLKNLFPLIFSVLGGTINALIDSAFVSQRLGNDGLAALNISMPVFLVICTVGSLIAGGASVLSAQAMGKDKVGEAQKIYRMSVVLGIISSVVMTVLGLVLCGPISVFLSGNGDLYTYVYQYCFVMFIGVLPYVMIYTCLYYLQLEGKTRQITVSMILMIALDVVLDFVFLFVFNMGMIGASLASIVSIAVACIYGFISLERGFSNYHFKWEKITKKDLKEISYTGSPIAIVNLADAIRLLLLNVIILHVGGLGAMAIWAVLNSLCEFAISIISGVPQAAAPMTGAYYTARENSGIRILLGFQIRIGLLLTAIFAAFVIIFHGFFEGLFRIETSLFVPFIWLGIYCLLELVLNVWTYFFRSTKRIMLSNALILMRKLAFPVLALLIFMTLSNNLLFAFLPLGTLLSIIVGLIITGIVSGKTRDSRRPLSRYLLLDDSLERENKVIDFSITTINEDICEASERISEFCAENNMSPKQTMQLGLAIEEILTVYVEKNDNLESVDLRAFALDDTTGIRIRCAGIRYNPFEADDEDDFLMGVNMIEKIAEIVTYNFSLGTNNLNIMFDNGEGNISVD